MRKLSILCDLDDVLNNLLDMWVDALNQKHNLSVSVDDVRGWEMHQAFPWLQMEEVYEPLHDKSFWSSLSPQTGAQDGIQWIIDRGHDLKIVTASHYKNIDVKITWLLQHFPMLNWDDVVVTQDKRMIKADILIDDGLHNLAYGKYFGILLDKPHNRDFNEELYSAHTQKPIFRAYNWEHIKEIIQYLEEEHND